MASIDLRGTPPQSFWAMSSICHLILSTAGMWCVNGDSNTHCVLAWTSTQVSSHHSVMEWHYPVPDRETQQRDGKSLRRKCGLTCPRTLTLWVEGYDCHLVEGVARRPVPSSELVLQAVCRITSYQYPLKHGGLKFTIKQGWPWFFCLRSLSTGSIGVHHHAWLDTDFFLKKKSKLNPPIIIIFYTLR